MYSSTVYKLLKPAFISALVSWAEESGEDVAGAVGFPPNCTQAIRLENAKKVGSEVRGPRPHAEFSRFTRSSLDRHGTEKRISTMHARVTLLFVWGEGAVLPRPYQLVSDADVDALNQHTHALYLVIMRLLLRWHWTRTPLKHAPFCEERAGQRSRSRHIDNGQRQDSCVPSDGLGTAAAAAAGHQPAITAAPHERAPPRYENQPVCRGPFPHCSVQRVTLHVTLTIILHLCSRAEFPLE